MELNGEWKKFNDKEEMRLDADGYRVKRLNWIEPGYYFVTTGYQPCPRGCCEESFIEYTYREDREREIKEFMITICNALKECKGLK